MGSGRTGCGSGGFGRGNGIVIEGAFGPDMRSVYKIVRAVQIIRAPHGDAW